MSSAAYSFLLRSSTLEQQRLYYPDALRKAAAYYYSEVVSDIRTLTDPKGCATSFTRARSLGEGHEPYLLKSGCVLSEADQRANSANYRAEEGLAEMNRLLYSICRNLYHAATTMADGSSFHVDGRILRSPEYTASFARNIEDPAERKIFLDCADQYRRVNYQMTHPGVHFKNGLRLDSEGNIAPVAPRIDSPEAALREFGPVLSQFATHLEIRGVGFIQPHRLIQRPTLVVVPRADRQPEAASVRRHAKVK